MAINLSAELRKIPDSTFFKAGKLALNQVFGALVEAMTGGAKVVETSWLVQNFPNMASLQRLAAFEAARRKKLPPAPVKPTLEAAYGVIEKAAQRAYSKNPAIRSTMEVGDLAQGYFEKYLAGGLHDKFDPSKGTPFEAWIGQGISRWVIDHLRCRKFSFQQDGETVSRTVSLDKPVSEDGLTLQDMLTSPSEDPLSEMVMEEALSVLDARSKSILRERIEGYTQSEIADRCGITRGRVSQLITKAKSVLSKFL